MTMQSTLFLHHEVMLLALHETQGTVVRAVKYQYAIAGAVLAELLLNKRITLNPSGKKQIIEPIGAEPLGEPLIDRCLEKMNIRKKSASLQTWISRLATARNLNDRVAQQLAKRSVLRAARGRVLLIFKRSIYPQVDPGPRSELVERLRGAVLTDAMHVAPRTVILLSIANSTGLLRVVFDKNELNARKGRIEQIVDGEIIGKATREAIEAMRTEVVAP
ncbi:MAG: GPP34 family phosphoprotein [Planctomycetota bacterium]